MTQSPPQPPSTHIPSFYCIWFATVDPLVCLATSFACFWDPDLGLTAVVPAAVSTRNPYQDFLFHQTGALYLLLAVVLAVDFVLLCSQYY
ncbi:hypothetical protein KJ359_009345 [Pestalotiopsis sp. 9143b]|nr:hypothetical protein KJ359_009345 [Pestalotiopsis sp. 9143b]